jgi:hypothetical protein
MSFSFGGALQRMAPKFFLFLKRLEMFFAGDKWFLTAFKKFDQNAAAAPY